MCYVIMIKNGNFSVIKNLLNFTLLIKWKEIKVLRHENTHLGSKTDYSIRKTNSLKETVKDISSTRPLLKEGKINRLFKT